MLLAQALLVYLPLPVFGQSWLGLASFLAGSALLVLSSRTSWIVFGLVVASTGWLQAALDGVALDVAYTVIGTAVFGLEVYLLTSLARLVAELHAVRTELARRAVAEERRWFASNLDDLLGLSLSAIALKGELARRLIVKSRQQTKRQLAEINEIARRALADVRSVARSYRQLSLAGASRIAVSLLTAADVESDIALDVGELPAQIRAPIVTALRQGVAAVLRRQGVRRCEITARQTAGTVSLDIVDDGSQTGSITLSGPLRDTIRALGGTIATGPGITGGAGLHVTVPVTGGPARGDRPSAAGGGLVRVPVILTFAGLCVSAAVHVLYLTTDPGKIAVGAACVVALLVLQLTYFDRVITRPRVSSGAWLLLAQACLVYLPLLYLRQDWVSLPGFLAGTAVLVLPIGAGAAVFMLTLGSVVTINAGFGVAPREIVFNVVATAVSGLVVYGLTWLTRLVAELDTGRTRLTQLALTEERLRFARDLHDLLGLSLSAITLKTELADRLLAVDDTRAAAELTEILDLTRQALADVRSVASGNRELSLDAELRMAQSVLTAADVQVRVAPGFGHVPVHARTVLAVVLREGVTNMLRHSKVERCEIMVCTGDAEASLDIVNDGAEDQTAAERSRDVTSSGIRNLSYRVGALGGELTAGVDPDGRFRLHAAVPAPH